MNKYIFIALFLFFTTKGFAQNIQQTAMHKVSFSGGLWAGTNKTTSFVGFIGPKISCTIICKKTTIEVGLTGVPGIMIRPEIKLGLSAGATLILKKEGWRVKPVLGVMFIKTTTWQLMPGIGFQF